MKRASGLTAARRRRNTRQRRRADDAPRADQGGPTGDPSSWGLADDALALPANADVATRSDAAGRLTQAHRADVFDRLHARRRLSAEGLAAVRRLERDNAIRRRADCAVGDFEPHVDVSRRAFHISDARLDAGRRVDAVLMLCGVASARLLKALCEAGASPASIGWREIVTAATTERLADAQTAVVRAACENLAGAYAAFDRSTARAGTSAASRPAGAP